MTSRARAKQRRRDEEAAATERAATLDDRVGEAGDNVGEPVAGARRSPLAGILIDVAIVLAAFAVAAAIAAAAGAANFGTALAFGQIGFALALAYVLVRRD